MSLWGPSFSEPQVVRENSACVWKAIWQTNPCGNGLTPHYSRLLPLSPLLTPRPVIPGGFVILGSCFSGLHSLTSRAQFRHHSLSLDTWTKFQWPSSVAPPLGSTPPLLSLIHHKGIYLALTLLQKASVFTAQPTLHFLPGSEFGSFHLCLHLLP